MLINIVIKNSIKTTKGDNISCVRTQNVQCCKDSDFKRIVGGNF